VARRTSSAAQVCDVALPSRQYSGQSSGLI
jgi:hypothetical protein